MRRSISLVLSAVLVIGVTASANARDTFAGTVMRLAERCRIAIETGRPVDRAGLIDNGVSSRDIPPLTFPGSPEPFVALPGYLRIERRWTKVGARFDIVEAEIPYANGEARRSCEVQLSSGSQAIAHSEAAELFEAFRVERQRLIDSRTHEVRDPDPTPPMNSLGFGPIGPNSRGCSIISALFVDTSQTQPFFLLVTGEQSGECSGPSMLK